MKSVIFIALALLSFTVAKKSIVVFHSEECYSKVKTLSNVFAQDNSNHEVIDLEYLNMIIVNNEMLKENVSLFSNDCVKDIVADEEIKVDLPKAEISFSADFKQWHLKSINSPDSSLPDSFERRIQQPDGVETHVVLIDSGIDREHPELKDKLSEEGTHKSYVDQDFCCDTDSDPLCDCAEHGTHCAGLIASETAGYNKSTKLTAVKVFDQTGSTTFAIILQGMNYAGQLKIKNFKDNLTLVSMSLGGGKNNAINAGVKALAKLKVLVVVAAGNDTADSCLFSPASSTDAFTVGAYNIDSQISSFSNFGHCTNIFAPGEQIWSTKPGNKYQFLSGTSMATPIVAGFVSALGSANGITNDIDALRTLVHQHTKHGVISGADPNVAIYDGKQTLSFLDN